jgi:DNA-binding transcriptional activator of the SARP family
MDVEDVAKCGKPGLNVTTEPNLFPTSASAQTESHSQYRVHLLGGFRATHRTHAVELPTSTWRLVAFLAIAGDPVERSCSANSLWMDKSESRAHANLRTYLWRLRQTNVSIVGRRTQTRLCIYDDVLVDHRELVRVARMLADERAEVDLNAIEAEWFCAELPPDWFDNFLDTEREQFRKIRLHALKGLARRPQRVGRTRARPRRRAHRYRGRTIVRDSAPARDLTPLGRGERCRSATPVPHPVHTLEQATWCRPIPGSPPTGVTLAYCTQEGRESPVALRPLSYDLQRG